MPNAPTTCVYCGGIIPAESNTCPLCGAPIDEQPTGSAPTLISARPIDFSQPAPQPAPPEPAPSYQPPQPPYQPISPTPPKGGNNAWIWIVLVVIIFLCLCCVCGLVAYFSTYSNPYGMPEGMFSIPTLLNFALL